MMVCLDSELLIQRENHLLILKLPEATETELIPPSFLVKEY